ncbi:hypothetical protein [Roseofilum sp. Guam]|uniref:hypothetical protein n=1 Tax=Roseofilum sp. Guam TaxID=2821502 RepID=UPI00298D8228|nr:hypothetical protein [Roseofilum sp. Guam]
MQAILLSSEEVAKRAYQIYEGEIRQKVETEENIGKMVIINVETGDYDIDETGLQAAKNLQAKSPRITSDEIAELDGIGELDRIFTQIHAMLAAQHANQCSDSHTNCRLS